MKVKQSLMCQSRYQCKGEKFKKLEVMDFTTLEQTRNLSLIINKNFICRGSNDSLATQKLPLIEHQTTKNVEKDTRG